MRYKLFCGDAVPGCEARFEADSRERVIDLVTAHAREAHGVTDVTPEMLSDIEANIVTA